jgi:hypothetical protein
MSGTLLFKSPEYKRAYLEFTGALN